MGARLLHRLWRDRCAATAIEYGLLIAFIAAVIFGTVSSLRDLVMTLFGTVTAIPF